MRDFFAFRTMISGFVIQIVFVLGLIAIVVGSIGALANDQVPAGVLILVVGTLYWRIFCEVLIVVFRMNRSLDVIKDNTAGLAPALSAPGAPVGPADMRMGEAGLAASASTAVLTGESDPAAGAPAVAAAPEAALPPAGWYDDSERPGHKRWWDGTTWGTRDDEHSSAG